MKATLTFEIECSEKSCRDESGKCCAYLRINTADGTTHCRLFGRLIEDKQSTVWIQRHPDCLRTAQ